MKTQSLLELIILAEKHTKLFIFLSIFFKRINVIYHWIYVIFVIIFQWTVWSLIAVLFLELNNFMQHAKSQPQNFCSNSRIQKLDGLYAYWMCTIIKMIELTFLCEYCRHIHPALIFITPNNVIFLQLFALHGRNIP